jgi:hypothetical protein
VSTASPTVVFQSTSCPIAVGGIVSRIKRQTVLRTKDIITFKLWEFMFMVCIGGIPNGVFRQRRRKDIIFYFSGQNPIFGPTLRHDCSEI